MRLLLKIFTGLTGLSLILAGCTGISLHDKITTGEDDWLMAGGTAKHQNVSPFILEPPLDAKWDYDVDAGVGYSAISVSDAVVFVNTLAGDMLSFDITGGNKLGRLTFLGKDASSNPLVIDNDVILSFAGDKDYSLLSYNLETGLTNWRINLGFLQTSPVPQENFVYIGSLNGNFYKINTRTDSIYWKFSAGSQIHSTGAIDNDKTVFGCDNGYIYCLNINDGSLAWKYKTGAPVFATPLIYDGKVYIGSFDTNYYCINAADGSLKWKKNMGTKITGGTTLYYKKDIVFGGINGILYSLNAEDGSENWEFTTKGSIVSSPLSSGNNIYFTSYDFNLYCIDGGTGKESWRYTLDGKSKTSPVIWKDFLIVAADKVVYCFTKHHDAVK